MHVKIICIFEIHETSQLGFQSEVLTLKKAAFGFLVDLAPSYALLAVKEDVLEDKLKTRHTLNPGTNKIFMALINFV